MSPHSLEPPMDSIMESQAAKLDVQEIKCHDASEDFIRSAVHQADVNSLRLALFQITHDPDLEAIPVKKIDILGGAVIDYVVSGENQEKVRQKAINYLLSGPHDIPPPPSREEASRLMDLFCDIPMRSDPLISFSYDEGYEELAFEKYPRDVRWGNDQPPPATVLKKWKVLIIGAGISGIAAAIPLKQLGIPFEIIEKQGGIGGTWLQNNYPNVRVDSPGYLFQYRFTKKYKWKQYFPAGGDIQDYLNKVAMEYGVKEHMRFHREVVAAEWDEETSKWNLMIRHQDGSEEGTTANIVISASGLFSEPNLSNINGMNSYKRPIFHTSRWDHRIPYEGKKVALIGTGSTGTQVAPALVQKAKHLTVFQRTANWIVPFEFFSLPVTENVHWLMEKIPYYWNWYCYGNFFKSLNFATLQSFDEVWRAEGGYISERNDNVRKALVKYYHEYFADRPDLIPKIMPTHAPQVRRKVVDNGFYNIIKQENVDLVTDGIDYITETGIKTKDGIEREFDMIILGAGFKVSQYFWPVDYKGRDGMTLQKAWEKDGARSYLGMTMPKYPNFFSLYGPNHQPRAGSLHSFGEKWARYAVSAIVDMIEGGCSSIEVRKEVFDEYNARLDAANKKLIWESEGSGYFVNEHGRQAVNMPWTNAEYHSMIEKVNLDDFHLT